MCGDQRMAINASSKKRRSKPCSICRRWFTPNPKVGQRQRTCGSKACKSEQKKHTQAKWSKRNPSYWVERRLQKQIETITADKDKVLLQRTPAIWHQFPFEFAQDAISPKGYVILLCFARMLHRTMQDAFKDQQNEIKGEITAICQCAKQEVLDIKGPAP